LRRAASLAAASWIVNVDAISTNASLAALSVLLGAPGLRLRRLRISLKAAAIPALLELPALAGLLSLHLDVPDDVRAAAIALASGGPTTLVELHLGSAPNAWGSATGQRSQDAAVIGDALAPLLSSERLARLQTLVLDTIDAASIEALAAHPTLEALTVGRPSDELAARIAAEVLPRLSRLSLGHAGPACARSLALVTAPRLRALSLSRGIGEKPMSAADARAAVAGLSAPELRTLRLSDCNVDRSVAAALGDLSAPHLGTLSLDGDEAGSGVVGTLVTGPLAPRLMTLSVTCGTSASGDVLAIASATLPALQRLSITNAPRDAAADAAIGSLGRSSGHPELRQLHFYHAGNLPSFGTAGAKSLLEVSNWHLGILYINPTGVAAGTRKKLEDRYCVYPGASWQSVHLPFVARGHLEALPKSRPSGRCTAEWAPSSVSFRDKDGAVDRRDESTRTHRKGEPMRRTCLE
jgi:hypothetical protein